MKLTFLADANLHPAIGKPEAADYFPDGTPDPEVLAIAAAAGRVLVTNDVRTMNTHLAEFLKTQDSPGRYPHPLHLDHRARRFRPRRGLARRDSRRHPQPSPLASGSQPEPAIIRTARPLPSPAV